MIKRVQLTPDALDVAIAYMALDARDRAEFKRAIEVRSWLVNRIAPSGFVLPPIRVHVVNALRDESCDRGPYDG